MLKNIKRIIIVSLLLSMMFVSYVFAGTAKIEFGDPTVTRGKTIDLTLKVKSDGTTKLQNADITFTYDINMIEFVGPFSGTEAEGGAGQIRVTGKGSASTSKTLEYHVKFNALQSGETFTEILNAEVYDSNNDLVNITKQGKSKITIKPAKTSSKNANLKVLQITPGELDKDFDPTIVDYNTEVNADCDKLIINALPEDSDATVKITGNENFQVGNNRVVISVKASNNSTNKDYAIIVNKLDTGVTAGSTEIVDGIKLIGREYRVTTMPIPDGEILEGYTKGQASINNNNIEVLIANNDVSGPPETFLCYGISEKQEIGWFRYDNSDGTIQRYFEDPSVKEAKNYKGLYLTTYNDYNDLINTCNLLTVIAIVAGVLVLILFIVLMVTIIKSKNKNSNFFEDEDEYEDDEDDDFYTSKSGSMHRNNDDDYNDYSSTRNRANSDEDIEDLD